MQAERTSLLAELEADLRDEHKSITILLQKCLLLGGHSGSERLRQWARQELHGYFGDDVELPEHRRVGGVIRVDAIVGYNQITGQPISAWQLPKVLREKGVDESLPLRMGIGELEDMVRRNDKSIKLSYWGSANIAALMNAENKQFGQQVTAVYWDVSTSALHNILMLVRTMMVEMVAELLAALPDGVTIPSKELVDDVVGVVVHGDNTHVTVVQSQVEATPIVVSGANGTAVGSQTADSGSTVVGSQKTGDHGVVAGRDAATAAPNEDSNVGWWKRLRKRGVLVALFTVLGGLASIGALWVAAGWPLPW